MKTTTKTLLAAAALGAMTLSLATSGAEAMPTVQPLPLAAGAPVVTLTSGGCGPFAHRGFYGGCRPGGFGWHRGYGWHRGWGWHHWHHWHHW